MKGARKRWCNNGRALTCWGYNVGRGRGVLDFQHDSGREEGDLRQVHVEYGPLARDHARFGSVPGESLPAISWR